MRINNNITAMNTHRQYAINNDNNAKSTARLSSGYRINGAADDAAGLAISEKMRAQIRGLNMAAKNSQDAISLVQTAEGALIETESILQRMRELAVQSGSDTNDENVDRNALNAEFTQLQAEINDIASKADFNGRKLLNGELSGVKFAGDTTDALKTVTGGLSLSGLGKGDFTTFVATAVDAGVASANLTFSFDDGSGAKTYTVRAGGDTADAVFEAGKAYDILDADFKKVGEMKLDAGAAGSLNAADDISALTAKSGEALVIQTGSNENDTMNVNIGNMTTTGLAVNAAKIDSRADASTAITTVNDAINKVSTERSKLGAIQNRLDHKINNLNTSAENLQAAESRIRDIDMAKEMTKNTQNSILVQAATAMLAQANQAPQNVLSLLR